MATSFTKANADAGTATLDGVIERALQALRHAGVIVYPTETLYAVGVDAYSKAALSRLFALKGREPGKAIGLIAGSLEQALEVAQEVPEPARRLAEAFWPGPLTIVLPPRAWIAPELLGPTGGVAVRVSPHPLAKTLALALGRPLTATSANLSGEPPARTLAQARAAFGDEVDVYLDGGHLDAPLPSTVVAFVGNELRILRHGAVDEAALRAALAD